MSDAWNILVPGPIPSTNHIYGYTNGRVYKKPGIEAFQTVIAHLTRLARPKGWKTEPKQQIRVTFDFFLQKDADCDNLMKMTLDAVALGLGVDDRVFLPCARSKTINYKNDPLVAIEIENVHP